MTKVKLTDESLFKFWRQNLKANEFKLTLKEMKLQYLAFLKTKDADWILYYGDETVMSFIGSKEGLNSTMDMVNYNELCDELMPVRHSLPCYSKTGREA